MAKRAKLSDKDVDRLPAGYVPPPETVSQSSQLILQRGDIRR
jgi:hypothetical protein